jgi:clan AA aspartic protease
MVDTGAGTLVITEKVRSQLGLNIMSKKLVSMANNAGETVQITEGVEIIWKNRKTLCRAWVIPGDGEILLGTIPLEDMDLMVNPSNRELVGAHGDVEIGLLK